MIIFGTAVTDSEVYDRCAMPGIRRAAEPDSIVFAHHTAGSVFRNYNLLLDKSAPHEDLEGLVLLHQDVEIADRDFLVRVRKAFSDADVAVIGCAGAVGVRSIAWWQGAVTWASMTLRYPEYGGGDEPAMSWRRDTAPSYANTGEVDSIDGLVMVLSPWAVRELRFDESLGKLHGYDFDICMQARTAGKKVVTADLRVIHHHSLELIRDPETWVQSYVRLVEKWDGQLPDTGAELRQHALRAEAEAACARALMVTEQMRTHAIKRRLDRAERDLESTRERLESTTRELAATKGNEGTDVPSAAKVAPGPGRLVAIDYAVEDLGVESFASLEVGQAYGQYAFYMIDKPAVRRGFLVDAADRSPGDHLLSAIDNAAERPGMLVLDGSFFDPSTVSEIGQIDAVVLYDVLLRMVDPDWNHVLQLYAPVASSFVIVNPQWEKGEGTIRLIDLGRDRYLETVPPWVSHRLLFDHLDDWFPGQQRCYRDANHVWQWGITDAALKDEMSELGFSLAREWTLARPPDTHGFLTKAFVFSRSQA